MDFVPAEGPAQFVVGFEDFEPRKSLLEQLRKPARKRRRHEEEPGTVVFSEVPAQSQDSAEPACVVGVQLI